MFQRLARSGGMAFDRPMTQYLWIGLGSALGGMARFAVGSIIGSPDFPYGTLVVNVTGALLIGMISALNLKSPAPEFWIIGVLGGYTTFSAFSLQTFELIQSARPIPAILYTIASVILCLLAVIAGQAVVRAAR